MFEDSTIRYDVCVMSMTVESLIACRRQMKTPRASLIVSIKGLTGEAHTIYLTFFTERYRDLIYELRTERGRKLVHHD